VRFAGEGGFWLVAMDQEEARQPESHSQIPDEWIYQLKNGMDLTNTDEDTCIVLVLLSS
jgi:hypothetical protein